MLSFAACLALTETRRLADIAARLADRAALLASLLLDIQQGNASTSSADGQFSLVDETMTQCWEARERIRRAVQQMLVE